LDEEFIMTTYKDYLDQIAKLQSLAELARQQEIAEARRQIREIMQTHKLSLADLSAPPAASKAKSPTGPVKAKYKDPATGATWSGRGRTPRWLDGRAKEKFLIK